MRKLIVHEFMSLDGVIQAPGGKDEDTDGGFAHGGWTVPFWHDDIGATFFSLMQNVDALLLGRKTYQTHAEAFEPMPKGDVFGDLMNAPKKFVVSKTIEKPLWRDTTVIKDDVVGAVRALKAQPGKDIVSDGSSVLVRTLLAHDLVDELFVTLYPVILGGGKRIFPDGVRCDFKLTATKPYPTGVVGLHYVRAR